MISQNRMEITAVRENMAKVVARNQWGRAEENSLVSDALAGPARDLDAGASSSAHVVARANSRQARSRRPPTMRTSRVAQA
jgi:hypothetical protein